MESINDKAKLYSGAIESSQACQRPNLSLPAKVTKKLQVNSMTLKNETPSVSYEQRELRDIKGKGNSKDSKCKPNSGQKEPEVNGSCKGSICNPSVGRLKEICSSEGKGSETEENGADQNTCGNEDITYNRKTHMYRKHTRRSKQKTLRQMKHKHRPADQNPERRKCTGRQQKKKEAQANTHRQERSGTQKLINMEIISCMSHNLRRTVRDTHK